MQGGSFEGSGGEEGLSNGGLGELKVYLLLTISNRAALIAEGWEATLSLLFLFISGLSLLPTFIP